MLLSEAAARAGVALRTLQHAVKMERLRARRAFGRYWVTTMADVADWRKTANHQRGRPKKQAARDD